MPASCPHCSKAIESLSGFVSQEVHQQRINEKETARKALEVMVTDLTPKAQGYEATATTIATLQRELAVTREDHALSTTHKVNDPKTLASLRAIHAAEVSGLEEGKRPTLQDWLAGDGAAHPVVSLVLAKATTTPATTTPAATTPAVATPAVVAPVVPAVNVLPGTTPAANPPAGGPRLTPEQTAAYFESADYKALSKDDKAKKKAELRTTTSAPASVVG